MGIYINPSDTLKEDWLHENATKEHDFLTRIVWNKIPKNHLPVCLVDNGAFTAAGVAFNEKEFDHFDDPSDRRLKLWFIVEIKKLLEVLDSNDCECLLKRLKE